MEGSSQVGKVDIFAAADARLNEALATIKRLTVESDERAEHWLPILLALQGQILWKKDFKRLLELRPISVLEFD